MYHSGKGATLDAWDINYKNEKKSLYHSGRSATLGIQHPVTRETSEIGDDAYRIALIIILPRSTLTISRTRCRTVATSLAKWFLSLLKLSRESVCKMLPSKRHKSFRRLGCAVISGSSLRLFLQTLPLPRLQFHRSGKATRIFRTDSIRC